MLCARYVDIARYFYPAVIGNRVYGLVVGRGRPALQPGREIVAVQLRCSAPPANQLPVGDDIQYVAQVVAQLVALVTNLAGIFPRLAYCKVGTDTLLVALANVSNAIMVGIKLVWISSVRAFIACTKFVFLLRYIFDSS